MYIYNLQKLKDYKEKVLHQQELLNISTIFTVFEKLKINEVYDSLLKIVSDKVAQMEVATKNATGLTVFDYQQL